MKILIITSLLVVIFTMPCLAETSTIFILKPNTDGSYEQCEGTYIHINHKTDEKTYYVQGKIGTLEEYNTAMANYVPPKTIADKIIDLESEVEKLKIELAKLKVTQ